MVVRKIRLTNFRSHADFSLDFSEQITEIIGRNGWGKTSILEAIYEALQGKSFRAVDREIVRRGEEFYRIELEYEDGRRVVVAFDGEKKEFLVEDKKTRRLPKKLKYPIVLFEPDDLRLIGASPTSRRNYFDRMFGQLMEKYSVALARYNKALKQRNELLKREFVTQADLFSWNMLLVQYGVEVMKMRSEWTKQIGEKITEVYRSIADNEDEIGLRYMTEVSGENEFLRELEERFSRDVMLGHTSFGVHHDNYEFFFNGTRADGSASRGEVRSIVIGLKFIEAEMVVEEIGKSQSYCLMMFFQSLMRRGKNVW